MKGTKILTASVLGLILLAATACGSKKEEEASPAVSSETVVKEEQVSEEIEAEAPAESPDSDQNPEEENQVSTLTGTLDEVKSFMFVVTDSNGDPYAFPLGEEAPEGFSDLEVGDHVTVTYTGKLSMVDAFTGEIISVTKAE